MATISINRKQKVGKNQDAIIGENILPIIEKWKNARATNENFLQFKTELLTTIESVKYASSESIFKMVQYVQNTKNFIGLLTAAYQIQLGGRGLGLGKDTMGKQSLRKNFI